MASAYLLITAWFAWTPLPMIVRMPIGLLLTLPFGLILAIRGENGSELGWLGFGALFFALVSLFIAEKTWTYVGCVSVLVIFVSLPLIRIWVIDSSVFGKIDPTMISYTWLAMLSLATIVSLPRWFGYRLRRVFVGTSDAKLSLATGRTIDQWLVAVNLQDGNQWNHAETMHFLRQQGVPFDLRKSLTDCIFRLQCRAAPKLIRSQSPPGFAKALQWATTGGNRENQFSTRQLIFWIASAAILFALLAHSGLSSNFLRYFIVLMPGCLALGLGVIAMAARVLMSHEPFSHRVFILLSIGLIATGVLLASKVLQLSPAFTMPVAMIGAGAGLGLWLWMAYLRIEGFRLIRSAR